MEIKRKTLRYNHNRPFILHNISDQWEWALRRFAFAVYYAILPEARSIDTSAGFKTLIAWPTIRVKTARISNSLVGIKSITHWSSIIGIPRKYTPSTDSVDWPWSFNTLTSRTTVRIKRTRKGWRTHKQQDAHNWNDHRRFHNTPLLYLHIILL